MLDTTIVVLALPKIQRGLHVDLSAVVWVIISFLLAITLLATQVGRLGDMFGRVRMYETGLRRLRARLAGVRGGLERAVDHRLPYPAVIGGAFAKIGMVFSFAVAILIASRSISRGLAFAIFVGSTSLHGTVADAFTAGLHAAFYASMGFMALAAGLSALRAGSSRV